MDNSPAVLLGIYLGNNRKIRFIPVLPLWLTNQQPPGALRRAISFLTKFETTNQG